MSGPPLGFYQGPDPEKWWRKKRGTDIKKKNNDGIMAETKNDMKQLRFWITPAFILGLAVFMYEIADDVRDDINGKIKENAEKIDGLGTKIDSVESKVDYMGGKIDTIEKFILKSK